jgi:ribosomal protein S27AE
MEYYAICEQCGKSMGMIEHTNGRKRRYCSGKCKQAAYRSRKKRERQEKKRNADMLRFERYCERWLGDRVSKELVSMAMDYDIQSARRAVDIAILTAQITRRASQEKPGEALPIDQTLRAIGAQELPGFEGT